MRELVLPANSELAIVLGERRGGVKAVLRYMVLLMIENGLCDIGRLWAH